MPCETVSELSSECIRYCMPCEVGVHPLRLRSMPGRAREWGTDWGMK